MSIKLLAYPIIGASLAIALASCSTHRTTVYSNAPPVMTGPPPHAPAHGYRLHRQGVELLYDSSFGIYTVHRHPNHYYYDDHFYRCRESVWEVSVDIKGPWAKTTLDRLPSGLKKREIAIGEAKAAEKAKEVEKTKTKKAGKKTKRW